MVESVGGVRGQRVWARPCQGCQRIPLWCPFLPKMQWTIVRSAVKKQGTTCWTANPGPSMRRAA